MQVKRLPLASKAISASRACQSLFDALKAVSQAEPLQFWIRGLATEEIHGPDPDYGWQIRIGVDFDFKACKYRSKTGSQFCPGTSSIRRLQHMSDTIVINVGEVKKTIASTGELK
jgi:hypothetical protein